jgi:hypothetical protein
LDLLGFIRPNRAFSMGYSRKNKKIRPSLSGCVQIASQPVTTQPDRSFPAAAKRPIANPAPGQKPPGFVDSWIPGQTCGLPGMTRTAGKRANFPSSASVYPSPRPAGAAFPDPDDGKTIARGFGFVK